MDIPKADVFLWNLAVKDSQQIPDENIFKAIYGFGFDSTNDDYKVLKIVQVEKICYTAVYNLKRKARHENELKIALIVCGTRKKLGFICRVLSIGWQFELNQAKKSFLVLIFGPRRTMSYHCLIVRPWN